MDKKYLKHLFVTTIIVMALIFVLGIIIGKNISSYKETEITSFIKNSELNTESYLLEQNFIEDLDNDTCQLAMIRLTDISSELGSIGRALTEEGAKEELGYANFDYMKRKYHLMQIRAYLLFYKLLDNCNVQSDIVLFYYGDDDEESGQQGIILDKVVSDMDVTVFAMEYNYSTELNFLESFYEIEKTPSMIINYDTKKEGLVDYKEIESIIKEE